MVRGRAGLAETRRRGDDAGQGRARWSPSTSPTRRAALDRAGPARPARGRDRPAGGRAALRRLAHLLRAPRRDAAPSCSCSRISTGPTAGTARLHRPPARVEPRDPALRRDPGPARSCIEQRPDWGAGRRNFDAPLPRAAARGGDARAPGRARARACPEAAVAGDRGARRRHAAVCRRDGPDARRRRQARRTRRRRVRADRATSTTLAVPETLDGAHRRPAGRARAGRPEPRPGRGRARPELHAGGARGRLRA